MDKPTCWDFAEMPGQEASGDLSQLATMANRLMTLHGKVWLWPRRVLPPQQQGSSEQASSGLDPIGADAAGSASHRSAEGAVARTEKYLNGRLVIISHGLWMTRNRSKAGLSYSRPRDTPS